jgi:hypothetical protein
MDEKINNKIEEKINEINEKLSEINKKIEEIEKIRKLMSFIGKDVVIWLSNGRRKYGHVANIEGSFLYLVSDNGYPEMLSAAYIQRIVLKDDQKEEKIFKKKVNNAGGMGREVGGGDVGGATR